MASKPGGYSGGSGGKMGSNVGGASGKGWGGGKLGDKETLGKHKDAKSAQMESLANAIAGKTPGLSTGAQKAAQVDAFVQGAKGYQNTNFAKAVKDFQDQGPWNKALDFFTGIHEVNPFSSWNGTPNASWGFDPLGVALGLGGLASGIPIGTLYGGVKAATGWRGPEIAFSGSPTAYGGYSPGGLLGQTASAQGPQHGRSGGTGNYYQQTQMRGRPKMGQPSIPQAPTQNQWGPAPTPQMPNLWAPQMPGLDSGWSPPQVNFSGLLSGMKWGGMDSPTWRR